jgi:hypothetical protein
MTDNEILAAFYIRRKHFDNYLKDNSLNLYTCPGCAYPTITEPGDFQICSICEWEDDGYDDNKKSAFDTFFTENRIGGPNGSLTLTQNRINIGRTLHDGMINLDTAEVLKTIATFDQIREGIEDRMTGEELLDHPIWTEWSNVRLDLQKALIHK